MLLNTVDPGLKIAGVTKRWESRCFQYCRPLIEPFRGDEKKVIEPFRNDGQGDGGGVQG